MTQLENAFTTTLGRHPTYMRPPYFEANEMVLESLKGLGYHVMEADIDTADWKDESLEGIAQALERFKTGVASGGSIVLSHDVLEGTVRALAPAMIEEARSRGLKMVTVGECLGDPPENWYVKG